MSGQDPNAIPQPDQPPAPEAAPNGSEQLDPKMGFEPYAPPVADQAAWDELRQDFQRNQTQRMDQSTAAMYPETPELGNTQRRKIRVISSKETHIAQMMSDGLGPPSPPQEQTLAYDVRPGESEDQARQRAMAAFEAIDHQGLEQQMGAEMDAMKYTAARAASQLTLGLSSVAPIIGTQNFERRFREQYPNSVAGLEWAAAGPAMMTASAGGAAKYLPMNAVFSGASRFIGRPIRNALMKSALRAGEGMKDLAMGWNQSLQGFMESRIGREVYQYVQPATIDALHTAWNAAGATLRDNIIVVHDAAAAAGKTGLVEAIRAFKAEATAAGWNAGKFRLVKVGTSATGGAAIGATDAIVRTLGANTPEETLHAKSSILPMALGGAFIGGAFGMVEASYNAARASFKPLERPSAPEPIPSKPAGELERMRQRQLNRARDIQ